MSSPGVRRLRRRAKCRQLRIGYPHASQSTDPFAVVRGSALTLRGRMRLAVFITVMLSWGCYAHVPETSVAPDPGTRVRVLLTDAGSTELARHIGPRVSTINGEIMRREDDGELALAVSSTVTRDGSEAFWKGEAVTVPRPYVAVLQRRKLAVARTVVLAGALAGAAIGLGRITGVVGGGGRGGGPPPPQ
jgi:hypothetical protein